MLLIALTQSQGFWLPEQLKSLTTRSRLQSLQASARPKQEEEVRLGP